MTERARPALASRPTDEQIARFAKLSAEERFRWLVDTMALCYELATPDARERWRLHKAGQ
jgi:hypothetical protein